MKPTHPSRREFLKATALSSFGFWIAGSSLAGESNSPNERIRFACVGVGGKGNEDTTDAARFGDIVAICDVDDEKLAAAGEKYPRAKRFNDWRSLLDGMAGTIDAVTVSTPDHSHAVVAAAAMRMGKHAFVQKPLTHSIYEARILGKIAAEQKVATQMGNQHTANRNLRRAAAIIKSGVLGPVQEIYVWTNRPVWPQGKTRPNEKPTPSHLHWDLFLGPAPFRPYGDDYHPFSWRGWWDFGTGAMGDMACHTMNMPFMALDLRDPISVQAETTGHNGDSYPSKSRITYRFCATDRHPELTLYWYDGMQKPSRRLLSKFPADALRDETSDSQSSGQRHRAFSDSGALVIGEKAALYAPGDYCERFYLSDVDELQIECPEPLGHFEEFVRAAKGGPPATSNFPDYASPLTETALLGNVAVWVANQPGAAGKKIEWDAKTLTAKNAPEVAHIIRREYRKGYSL